MFTSSSRPPSAAQADFFARLGDPMLLAKLFDYLPRIQLFIKDRAHRFVKVNTGMLTLHGCTSEAAMIGKTDFDFHPPTLAAQYVEEDREVMDSRRILSDRVWLVPGADGMPHWYLSTKMPATDSKGEVIGIIGVMRPYEHAGEAPGDYQRLARACEFVLAHFSEPIAMAEIAARAHLSISQLQREFQRLFAMTPGEYVLRVRLFMARRQLEHSSAPVGQVALDCGFYDQSHFTRAFRVATGLRPLEYRRRFSGG